MANFNRAKKLEGREKQKRHKIHNKGMANFQNNLAQKKATAADNILGKINSLTQKDMGVASDTFTPTCGGGGTNEKQRIKNRIDTILGKSISEIHGEAKQIVPATKTQKRILGDIEQFLDKYIDQEQVIQKFLNGYKKMALLSKSFSTPELNELLDIAKSINVFKDFNIKLTNYSDRLDSVIFIDSIAHNLHKVKFQDGSSLYKQLDEMADISKSIGETDRNDRLLLLQSPTANKAKLESLGIEVISKGLSLWNLYEKSIKVGVERLTNKELILLREFLWSKI